MSKWNDAEEWKRLCSGEACPICRDGGPHGVIAELRVSRLTIGEDSGIRGYCCLVLRRHAVELHDLTPDEAAALMRDLHDVSGALARVTGAVKLNYEIHGNTIPHLHVHLYPRYPRDPFENAPIDPSRVRGQQAYAPGEFEAFVSDLLDALATALTNNP